jgi:23S rRNA (pseudouridine1915-N3)-methyltransferase
VKIRVIAVGRLKADYARDGCADFVRRAGRSFDLEVVEVRDVPRSKNADIAACKAAEAASLRAAIPPGAQIVALDERGRGWSSRDFAEWIGRQRDRAVPAVAFVIGGPDGLDASLRDAAHRVWALGEMTMSHELARLVLCEQLYRAGTLLAGLPYHRD